MNDLPVASQISAPARPQSGEPRQRKAKAYRRISRERWQGLEGARQKPIAAYANRYLALFYKQCYTYPIISFRREYDYIYYIQ